MTVTLTSPAGKKDLELPSDIPVQRLLPALVRALALPSVDAQGQAIPYELCKVQGSKPLLLEPARTLAAASVLTGGFLQLSGAAGVTAPADSTSAISYSNARVRCGTGRIIALDNVGKSTLTVGRYNARTDEMPDIDLSDERDSITVSRPHAHLLKQSGHWVIEPVSGKEIKINGELAPPAHILTPGDVIGLGGVKLLFDADAN